MSRDIDTGLRPFDEVFRGEDDGNSAGKVYVPHVACHMSHPALPLGHGTLLGGNCYIHDRWSNVDLYVALDRYHKHPHYDPKRSVQPRAVHYPIQNMSVPSKPDKFDRLILDIVVELELGHTVHVGCIGGHGRTGLVLVAVAARMGYEIDPIKFVRDNYCKKAVESKSQIDFLVKHYGAKPHKPRHG